MTQNIELLKLETLKDAKYPQEDKYPSGIVLKTGFMFKHTQPKVGSTFNVMTSKLSPIFHTSTVTKIVENTDEYIVFKTLNSMYKIIIK